MTEASTQVAATPQIALTPWTFAQRRIPPVAWLATLSLVGMLSYAVLLLHLHLPPPAVATVAVIGLAALLSGIAGFAFSAICGAMLFHFRHDTVGVVETMLICSIANQAMSVWMLRQEIRLLPLAPFLLGGVVGVPVGVWLLLHLDGVTFKAVLGVLLAVYGFYMLVRRPITLARTSRASDVVSGFFGGLTGGFAATPGAPVSIWCGMKGWDKARQRGVFQPFILLMQFVALAAIAVMHAKGGPNVGIPPLAWACVPAGLLGTWWGMALFKRLTDRQFGKAVNLLLIASGIGLLA
jgi:uncharacterized membrane protein YfcA